MIAGLRLPRASGGQPLHSIYLLVTNSGRSAWFVGVLVLMVYLIFALTLYLLPPRVR